MVSGATAAGAAAALPTGIEAPVPSPDVAASTAPPGPVEAVQGTVGAVGAAERGTAGALGPAKDQPLNPLANTSVDPLNNSVGTQVADFRPVSTEPVTAPLSKGGTVRTLPATAPVAGLLPG